jgi:FAD/FMN-containing dehydrogenase
MGETPLSWGRYPRPRKQLVKTLFWRDEPLPSDSRLLAYGQGRSYGDSCLNDDGWLLATHRLDRFIEFDRQRGLLRCEAGVTLDHILRLATPHGWFLPTTPGTRFVSLGGAIANDVHGKNHHRAGTFGCHVTRLELLRSDGSRRICSRAENPDWLAATIGGLGLTGLITWAEIALAKIPGCYLDVETIRLGGLRDFFALAQESDSRFEHTVAWIDGCAGGKALGRGLFIRGNHSPQQPPRPRSLPASPAFTLPCDAPEMLLNRWSVTLGNALYYRRQWQRETRHLTHFAPFFYPLDAIGAWNRAYGPRGFLQYQCVVPGPDGEAAVREILAETQRRGQPSYLTVLKVFGTPASPGLLSFPMPGITLAMDFPFLGPSTLAMSDRLDEIVLKTRGRLYPAKDARMSAATFRACYPAWERFAAYIDPRFSSNFQRRVMAEAPCK